MGRLLGSLYMTKYIGIDTELGGLAPECSLLTAAFVVTDKHLNFIDSLEIKLKHKVYSLTAEGMKVNKIDIFKHDEEAEEFKECQDKIRRFLYKYGKVAPNVLSGENVNVDYLIPIGLGVASDIDRLKEAGFSLPCLSGQVRDLGVIAGYLRDSGLVEEDFPGTLEGMYRRLFDGFCEQWSNIIKFHTALGDAVASIMVYKEFVDDLSYRVDQ